LNGERNIHTMKPFLKSPRKTCVNYSNVTDLTVCLFTSEKTREAREGESGDVITARRNNDRSSEDHNFSPHNTVIWNNKYMRLKTNLYFKETGQIILFLVKQLFKNNEHLFKFLNHYKIPVKKVCSM